MTPAHYHPGIRRRLFVTRTERRIRSGTQLLISIGIAVLAGAAFVVITQA